MSIFDKLLGSLKEKRQRPRIFGLYLESREDKFVSIQGAYTLEEAFGLAKRELTSQYGSRFDENSVKLVFWDIKDPEIVLGKFKKEGPGEPVTLGGGVITGDMKDLNELGKTIAELLTAAAKESGIDPKELKDFSPEVKVMQIPPKEKKSKLKEAEVKPEPVPEPSPADKKNALMKKILDAKDSKLLEASKDELSKEEYLFLEGKIKSKK